MADPKPANADEKIEGAEPVTSTPEAESPEVRAKIEKSNQQLDAFETQVKAVWAENGVGYSTGDLEGGMRRIDRFFKALREKVSVFAAAGLTFENACKQTKGRYKDRWGEDKGATNILDTKVLLRNGFKSIPIGYEEDLATTYRAMFSPSQDVEERLDAIAATLELMKQ